MPASPAPARAISSYHHGNLRDALIAAALELEPEHGPLGAFFTLMGLGVAYVRFALANSSLFRFMYGTSPATAGALDGAPRSKVTRRTVKQRERRALDLVRVTVVGMLFGTRPPESKWRPGPPRRAPRGE
jgi:hypothetical protein